MLYKFHKIENRRRSQDVACRCHQAIFFKWGTFGADSVHTKMYSTFQTNQGTYKTTCDSKINLFDNDRGCFLCIVIFSGLVYQTFPAFD
jgi:hypothetical protein